MPAKKYTIVVWDDAFHTSGNFEEEAELESEDESYTIVTIGWLVRETDKIVTIAMDYEPAGGSYREVRRIRKENIRSIKILENEGS